MFLEISRPHPNFSENHVSLGDEVSMASIYLMRPTYMEGQKFCLRLRDFKRLSRLTIFALFSSPDRLFRVTLDSFLVL